MKKKLIIEFDNEEAADHFAGWLCGAGEQDYWDWMAYREREESGDITAVNFNYHPNNKWLSGPIVASCGRLDSEE